MPHQQLRNVIAALRDRLQQDLDVQLTSIAEQHEQALEVAKQSVEAESEQRWTAKLEGVTAEWTTRLESAVSGARAEAERRFVAEVTRQRAAAEQAAVEAAARSRAQLDQAVREATARVRAEGDQAAAEMAARLRTEAEQASAQLTTRLRVEAEEAAALAAVRVREEADQEVESERQRGIALLDVERERSSADLDAERQRAASLLDAERQRMESERQAERQRADADRLSERQRFDSERQQFRTERQRFEAERQHLMMERDRLMAEVQERVPVPLVMPVENRSEQLDQAEQAVRRLESALETERKQSRELTDALRQARESLRGVEAVLEEERQANASESAVRAASVAAEPAPAILIDAHVTERNTQMAMVDRLFGAMRAMDAAKSLTEVLGVLVEAAATEASRAALFIGSGEHLQGHKAVGFSAEIGSQRVPASGTGLLAQAVERREAVASSQESGVELPAFADLPAGRAAIAVPIAISGEPVAVLYADDADGEDQFAPASWPEAVQILSSHAASCLAHLTATRTAQAMRLVGNTAPSDDEGGARRYARLLVSEIKLYNEAAVRVGRENRDLLYRLRPEIDRARRLYEERVPEATGPQRSYFQQELVQTLANGDAALLGEPA